MEVSGTPTRLFWVSEKSFLRHCKEEIMLRIQWTIFATALVVTSLLAAFPGNSQAQVFMGIGPTLYKIDVNSILTDSGSAAAFEDEMVTVKGDITSTQYILPMDQEITLGGEIEIGYERPAKEGNQLAPKVWVTTRVVPVSGKHLFPKSNPIMPLMPQQKFPFDPVNLMATPLWKVGRTYYGRERVAELLGMTMEDWTSNDTRQRGTASFLVLPEEN